MMTVSRVKRLFEQKRSDELLQGLSDNGMALPLPLRVRLSQSTVAAYALALRRVTELTYGPNPLTEEMTTHLLHSQLVDGSFDRDPLATATGIAAINCVIHQQKRRLTRAGFQTPDDQLLLAKQRAIAALAGMQAQDGLFSCPDDRTIQDRALVAAFIHWLLGSDPQVATALRSADLLDWFDRHKHRLDRQTSQFYRMAQPHSRHVAQLN